MRCGDDTLKVGVTERKTRMSKGTKAGSLQHLWLDDRTEIQLQGSYLDQEYLEYKASALLCTQGSDAIRLCSLVCDFVGSGRLCYNL